MKKYILLILTIIILQLPACEPLPRKTTDCYFEIIGKYELIKHSKNDILIGKESDEFGKDIVVDSKVVELGWNSKYIIAKSIPIDEIKAKLNFKTYAEENEYIDTVPASEYVCWIISIESDTVYRLSSQEELENKIKELQIVNDIKIEKVESYSKLFKYE